MSLVLSACTLRIGGPNKLLDVPAPTTVPLQAAVPPEVVDDATSAQGGAPPDKPITLPPGFAITIYSRGLKNPRMMAISPDGHLYVAERGANRIIRLPDSDGDGAADEPLVVYDGLDAPSSLAFYQDGSLYVGETKRVLRLSEPSSEGVFQKQEVIVDGLPSGGHNTRTVLFSPDWSHLYVSVGSSCNVCEEADPRRAAIVRYNPDGSDEFIYAQGLRNAVGITYRPGTDELWATNNGRDMLGDDLPPETVYLVQEAGDYGWPRCHSGRISDPEFGNPDACQGVGVPALEMQAHSAPLGLEFYNAAQFPESYQGDLFIAFHGSWNRSEPTGYKVVRVPMDGGTPGAVEDFATGWLEGGSSWGRPVDLVTGSDGSLYVSDDGGGVIYRIFYTGP